MATSPPSDFAAIVITAPADVSSYSLDNLLEDAEPVAKKLRRMPGHRIIHARQITRADSATVATLIDLSRRAHEFGCEFAICDPSAMLDNYIDIYVPGSDREQHVCYESQSYEHCAVPWVPPFAASPTGRIDVWTAGKLTGQFEWTPKGVRPVPPKPH